MTPMKNPAPSVSLALHEGLHPHFAFLFCNDRAQLPVHVRVRAPAARIRHVGLYNAARKATSAADHALNVSELEKLLLIEYVDTLDARVYESHPVNKRQSTSHVPDDANDQLFTFLLSTRNHTAVKVAARGEILQLGAFVALADYKPASDASARSVTVRSHTDAKDGSSKRPSCRPSSRVRVELCAKPALRVSPLRQELSAFGDADGAAFELGAIYQLVADYGMHSEIFPRMRVRCDEAVFYSKHADDDTDMYKPVSNSETSSSRTGSNGRHKHVTFYADCTTGPCGSALRAVYHGAADSGEVTHESGDGTMPRYKFRKLSLHQGQAVSTFSWYCVRDSPVPCATDTEPARNMRNGRFKIVVSDLYGSETSMTVTCETASKGVLPVKLNFEAQVEHT